MKFFLFFTLLLFSIQLVGSTRDEKIFSLLARLKQCIGENKIGGNFSIQGNGIRNKKTSIDPALKKCESSIRALLEMTTFHQYKSGIKISKNNDVSFYYTQKKMVINPFNGVCDYTGFLNTEYRKGDRGSDQRVQICALSNRLSNFVEEQYFPIGMSNPIYFTQNVRDSVERYNQRIYDQWFVPCENYFLNRHGDLITEQKSDQIQRVCKWLSGYKEDLEKDLFCECVRKTEIKFSDISSSRKFVAMVRELYDLMKN